MNDLIGYYRALDTLPLVDSNCFFLAYQNPVPKRLKDKRKFLNNLNKGFFSWKLLELLRNKRS